LTWSPAKELSGVHVVSDEHSSSLGQAGAQNESPWNWAHTSPPLQSLLVVHWAQRPAGTEFPWPGGSELLPLDELGEGQGESAP
jgi:hypothetical protein